MAQILSLPQHAWHQSHMNAVFFPAHWLFIEDNGKEGRGGDQCVLELFGLASPPNTEIPESSNPQKVPENSPTSAFTSKKIALGYTLGTLPCCGCIALSFLCQRDFGIKLQGSSWVFSMFSGPFETHGSGEVEDVDSLNSVFFLYNQPSQQFGPSRKCSSLGEGKSRIGRWNSMERCQY